MPTINAITSPAPAIITTVDNTGNLVFQNAGTTNMTLDVNQNAIHTGYISAPNTFGFKNRIINGGMVIDQRNAGGSVTSNNIYSVDRWLAISDTSNKWTAQQNAGSVTPPAGFINYLGCTSSSAYTPISTDYFGPNQRIEGYNIADLNWGSASALPITLSFWVRSSLTGLFGGSIQNSSQNRSYAFPYTISSANTWEYKTITIPGDTTGTWLTNNGIGFVVHFSLGAGSSRVGTASTWTGTSNVFAPTGSVNLVGTSGATFYITGVQLEKGSVATPFDYRDYGREFILCQRYYQKNPILYGGAFSSAGAGLGYVYPVVMRANPTATLLTSTPYAEWADNVGYTATGSTLGGTVRTAGAEFRVYGFSGFTVMRPLWFDSNQISLSAEL